MKINVEQTVIYLITTRAYGHGGTRKSMPCPSLLPYLEHPERVECGSRFCEECIEKYLLKAEKEFIGKYGEEFKI